MSGWWNTRPPREGLSIRLGGADLQGQHHPARANTPDQEFDPTPKAGVAGSNPAGGTAYHRSDLEVSPQGGVLLGLASASLRKQASRGVQRDSTCAAVGLGVVLVNFPAAHDQLLRGGDETGAQGRARSCRGRGCPRRRACARRGRHGRSTAPGPSRSERSWSPSACFMPGFSSKRRAGPTSRPTIGPANRPGFEEQAPASAPFESSAPPSVQARASQAHTCTAEVWARRRALAPRVFRSPHR